MKNLDRICFILQARVGSSRLPGKVINPFAGSTLVEVAIEKIKESIFPTENLYLSARDPELLEIADNHNINVYLRDETSIRNDDTKPFTLPEVFDWWNKLDYDHYILMNVCNPLVQVETLNNFVEAFVKSDSRGLFSVVEHRRFFYRKDGSQFQAFYGSEEARRTFNTKFIEPIYSGGSLRAGTMEDVGRHVYMGSFEKPNDPPLFHYDSAQYIDIDYQWEFDAAEALYSQLFGKENKL